MTDWKEMERQMDPYDGGKPGMSQDKYLGFWTGASLFAIVVTVCLLILDWAGLIG